MARSRVDLPVPFRPIRPTFPRSGSCTEAFSIRMRPPTRMESSLKVSMGRGQYHAPSGLSGICSHDSAFQELLAVGDHSVYNPAPQRSGKGKEAVHYGGRENTIYR